MLTRPGKINYSSTISEIVGKHYRTADVFRKYGIDYCCGGKLPFKMVCELKELDVEELEKELEASLNTICISSALKFSEWNIDFLTDFIVNIHHEFLKTALPIAIENLDRFVEGHKKKYPHLVELQTVFHNMANDMIFIAHTISTQHIPAFSHYC